MVFVKVNNFINISKLGCLPSSRVRQPALGLAILSFFSYPFFSFHLSVLSFSYFCQELIYKLQLQSDSSLGWDWIDGFGMRDELGHTIT